MEDEKDKLIDSLKTELEDYKKRLDRYQDHANGLDNILRKAGEWLEKAIPDYEVNKDDAEEISKIMGNYLSLMRTWKVTVQAEWDVWIDLPYYQDEEDIDPSEFSVEISSYYYDLLDQTENNVEITNSEVK